ELRDDRRDDLVEVADHGPIGACDDRRVLVLVDHEDPLCALAADDVLDRAAHATRDIEVGRDACSRLSDLVGVGPPAEVGYDARTADSASEQARELLEHAEPLLASDAAAATDDDARGVQPNGAHSRLLAARDADPEVLVAQ